jgi:hypothetical protein
LVRKESRQRRIMRSNISWGAAKVISSGFKNLRSEGSRPPRSVSELTPLPELGGLD